VFVIVSLIRLIADIALSLRDMAIMEDEYDSIYKVARWFEWNEMGLVVKIAAIADLLIPADQLGRRMVSKPTQEKAGFSRRTGRQTYLAPLVMSNLGRG
jgi:hypothetical protein